MASRVHFAGLTAVVASLVGLVGCGGDKSAPASDVDSQTQTLLRLLANEYGEYLASHQDRVPKDEGEFRTFLEPKLSTSLASLQAKSVDDLLTSPRDNQPLVIATGTRREPSEAPGTAWALRERQGADGKVLAVGVRYGPVELSTADAESQIPSASIPN